MSEYKKIIAKINNEEFFPIYILVGDENYFADNIIKSLTSKLVTEDSKDFDYFKFYGDEVNEDQVIDAAKRFPLVGDYNFIVVKDAKSISKNFDKLRGGAPKVGDFVDSEKDHREISRIMKHESEERQEGFAVRYSLDGVRKVQAYKTEKDAQHRAKILKSMGGVKDVSITTHTLNFKKESTYESKLATMLNQRLK